jgi:hypothetical protein
MIGGVPGRRGLAVYHARHRGAQDGEAGEMNRKHLLGAVVGVGALFGGAAAAETVTVGYQLIYNPWKVRSRTTRSPRRPAGTSSTGSSTAASR